MMRSFSLGLTGFLRRHPAAAGFYAGVILAGGSALWGLCDRIAAARAGQNRLEQIGREWERVGRVVPEPTADNERRLTEDVSRAETALEELRGKFQPGESWHGAVHAVEAGGKSDVYFELVDFVSRMREQASARGVAVAEAERFGFADYEHDAPPAEMVEGVRRARAAAESLLRALFETRPRRLESLQRERLADASSREREISRSGGGGGNRIRSSDTFEIDRGLWPTRGSDLLDVLGFRVSFVGETETLRKLLNALASAESAFVVRTVEVERVNEERGLAAGERAWIERPWSRFTLVVDHVELARKRTPAE